MTLTIQGRKVAVRAWRRIVEGAGGAQIPVLFLDTDLPENVPGDRELTHSLYGGDRRYRLCQEVVLGVWGPVLELSSTELDALVRSLAADVRVPYLALHGAEPSPGYAEWLQQLVPTATVEVWDGSGHYPHLVHPARFLDRLRAFESALA